MDIILDKKYFFLKQLLVNGNYDDFDNEVAKLQFDELVEFSYFAYRSYKGTDFSQDYYGVKIIGEFTYLSTLRDIIILNPADFDENQFWEMNFKGLAFACDKALKLGFYNDAEKYAKQIVRYPRIETEALISFLSVLATCANKKGDKKEELEVCQRLLEIDKEDPKIIVSYAFALMENKEYEKSKYYLEKCIEKEYHDFKVYNYLALVAMYGDKNYVKAYSYLEKISEISHKGQKLTDRDRYVMYVNSLSISGLSGNSELLKNIRNFKNGVKNIKDKAVSNKWVAHAEICEFINIGIAQLRQGDNLSAKSYFDKIQNYDKKGEIIQLSEFLSKICLILEENSKIQNIDDVVSLNEFVNNLETITLFKDYKEIISQYYSLYYSFWSTLIDKPIDIDIQKNRDKLQQYSDLNLTTSDFINKSFSLLKLIKNYNNDFLNSILKERLKQEYIDKLKRLTSQGFDISNETTFLYSLNKVDNITNAICELMVKTILLIQKNEPSFIRDYKAMKSKGHKTSLLETDFRDIFYRTFGLSYDIEISAEALSRVGRTDLQIESRKFGTKTFEFKIWGSNDYKDVVKQTYEYLTDFEKEGFIFMVNKNIGSIKHEYADNLKRNEMGYIVDSFETLKIGDFEFYESKHKISIETKIMYHFIYNIH